MLASKRFKTMDEYISTFPKDTQKILEEIRKAIKKVVPQAQESISYQIPAFKLNNNNLVHFAAWKNHIGFYATPSGNQAFKKELSVYEGAKGSVRFPINEPIPFDLIKKIAKYRAQEVLKV